MFKCLASFVVLSTGICLGQSFVGSDMAPGPTSEPKKPIIFDVSAIDKTADPCVDFYQYACGNWVKKNPIPADQSRWGRFNELAERNNYLLYVELKAAADAPKTPLQKKYGDYFAACMNEDLADKLGAKPVEPVMKTIASLQDKKQLSAMVAELQTKYAVGTFYQLGVQQDQKDSSQQIVNAGRAALRCRTARTTSTTVREARSCGISMSSM
jgi:putative endopeptidase